MEYAQDGLLGKYDAVEIADAASWTGESDLLLQSLIGAGFIDPPISGCEICVHDWDEYGGKLLAKRRADAERKSADRSKDIQRTSNGHPTDIRVTAQVDKTTTTAEDNRVEEKTLQRPAEVDSEPLSWALGTSGGTPYVKQLREKHYTEQEIRWAIERYNLTPIPSKINGSPANYLAGMIREQRKKGGEFTNGPVPTDTNPEGPRAVPYYEQPGFAAWKARMPKYDDEGGNPL